MKTYKFTNHLFISQMFIEGFCKLHFKEVFSSGFYVNGYRAAITIRSHGIIVLISINQTWNLSFQVLII